VTVGGSWYELQAGCIKISTYTGNIADDEEGANNKRGPQPHPPGW
jgi:hypothetical protein